MTRHANISWYGIYSKLWKRKAFWSSHQQKEHQTNKPFLIICDGSRSLKIFFSLRYRIYYKQSFENKSSNGNWQINQKANIVCFICNMMSWGCRYSISPHVKELTEAETLIILPEQQSHMHILYMKGNERKNRILKFSEFHWEEYVQRPSDCWTLLEKKKNN